MGIPSISFMSTWNILPVMLCSWALACSLAWSRAKSEAASFDAWLTQMLGRRISPDGEGGAGVGVVSGARKRPPSPAPKATPVNPVLRRGFGRRSCTFLEPYMVHSSMRSCVPYTVSTVYIRFSLTHAGSRMRSKSRKYIEIKWPPLQRSEGCWLSCWGVAGRLEPGRHPYPTHLRLKSVNCCLTPNLNSERVWGLGAHVHARASVNFWKPLCLTCQSRGKSSASLCCWVKTPHLNTPVERYVRRRWTGWCTDLNYYFTEA